MFYSPLADIADTNWSIRHAAAFAAAERWTATWPSELTKLAPSWAAHNERAFLVAYLATPGNYVLLPTYRAVIRQVIANFEAVYDAHS